jgi:hypothetical protein
MITDEVSIYNLALSLVGTRSNVALPNEKSREAEICRLWFGPVRDRVLRAAPWPSTRAWSRLPLLKVRDSDQAWVADDPAPEFLFAYGVPSDMLAPRYLAGYQRFSLSSYPGNRLAIMTNQEDALLCYTSRQVVIGLWDTALQTAVVNALAAHIAMPLHGKASRAREALDQANSAIMQAREEAANIDMAPVETIPPWIQARGYGGSLSETRYFYPYGNLFSAGEIGV